MSNRESKRDQSLVDGNALMPYLEDVFNLFFFIFLLFRYYNRAFFKMSKSTEVTHFRVKFGEYIYTTYQWACRSLTSNTSLQYEKHKRFKLMQRVRAYLVPEQCPNSFFVTSCITSVLCCFNAFQMLFFCFVVRLLWPSLLFC